MIQLTNILNEDLRKWFGKGGAEIVSMIRDMKNREEVLHSMIEKFNKENVIYNRGEFTKMCGL